MILVTGATGTVGGYLLAELCQRGVAVRALVHSAERADSLRGYDCEVVVGDYADESSLRRALGGVRKVFLLSPVGPDQAEQEGAVVAALRAEGSMPHVVKLAALGYDAPDGPGRIGAQHRRVVEQLAAAHVPTTVLAPNSFMQNLLGQAASIQGPGVLYAPEGDPPVSQVDARDVAAVATHVLTQDGHDGASYVVTGPSAVTYREVAEQLSSLLSKPVRCESVSPEHSRAAMVDAGMSPWRVDALMELAAYNRTGATAVVTEDVTTATGHPARPLADFLTHHKAAFGG